MMIKNVICPALITILAAASLSGCISQGPKLNLDPQDPTVVILWHSYNSFAKKIFDENVLEFNDTVGLKEGIVIEGVGYGSSKELDAALYNSANEIIGSAPMPDIAVIYPDSAIRLDHIVPLADLNRWFTKEELNQYRPEFLEEGKWLGEGAQKMIPCAKSTELLYLNVTDWENFSRETGSSKEKLATWEGLAETAKAYYEWSGGRAFLGFNSFNDFMALSVAQLDADIYQEKDGEMVYTYPKETMRRIWDNYYVPHISGWYKSDTFNQDGIKGGNLLAYIGSSAGAAYFPTEVIGKEGQIHPIQCEVLSYPHYQGGIPYMNQRGANMCVFASNEQQEYAASEFIKWFTDPQRNVSFSINTGYLPVEQSALSSVSELLEELNESDNQEAVKNSVIVALNGIKNGKVFVKKAYPGSYVFHTAFGEVLEKKTAFDLDTMEVLIGEGADRKTLKKEMISDEKFEEWYLLLCKGNGW